MKQKIMFLILCVIMYGCNKEEQPVNFNEQISLNSRYNSDQIKQFKLRLNNDETNSYEYLSIRKEPILKTPKNLPTHFFYDSGVNIPYPNEGVKGIYVPNHVLYDENELNNIIDYVKSTELNAIVIDVKDDDGNIVYKFETDNKEMSENSLDLINLKHIIKKLDENDIYPIARIVTFKDNVRSVKSPHLSFIDSETGDLWSDTNGAHFLNPFLNENWEYILNIAEEAAKIGFKDIQFDYVRFPEAFGTFSTKLTYDIGAYKRINSQDEGSDRVTVIADFLTYAKEKLLPYGVHISADIFGYPAIAGDAPDVRDIGQNFSKIAEEVDVVSAMIYPSHWGEGFFGIDYPNAHPFETIEEYILSENVALKQVNNDVIRRPWIQDFTDYDLEGNNFMEYGVMEVQAQIDALKKHGISEYLLWNASGKYTEGVNY